MTKSTHTPDEDIAIRVRNLHKTFRIPLEGGNNLKQRIVNFSKRKKGYREFSPLNGISFEIKRGEFFGIVGRNGSGKSTLLKTIAGIYTPEKGSVRVNGKLVPFIELGVGFNPELTGRENVYLNGALLGFSRDEMAAMYDDIVEFAELEDFMDERLKNYSSGMQVRLAFSIAIRADGDVLLLDEVLAVGDQAFQQKCYDYFGQLRQEGKTVVLVTHSMSAVERFCTRGIVIDGGKIIAEGSNFEIAEKYQEIFIDERKKKSKKEKEKDSIDAGEVNLKSVQVRQDGQSTTKIKAGHSFDVVLDIETTGEVGPAAVGINLINSQGNIMLATGVGGVYDDKLEIKEGKKNIQFTVEDNIYTNDSYRIAVAVAKGERSSVQELILQKKDAAKFIIYGVTNRPHSLTHPKVSVKVK